jgi:hypothetical protein
MTYQSNRRQWVKLWVNEWLDGTTRFRLTAQQRVLWIDLLALAGRSRFPGFIYAGIDGGERIGYPLSYLAGVLLTDEITLSNTLLILRDRKHITLEETSPDVFVIGIFNWDKYQSDYSRQKTYRKVTSKVTTIVTPKVTTKNTIRLQTEGEVEGEKKKKEKESKSTAPAAVLYFEGSVLRITIDQIQRLGQVYGNNLLSFCQDADLYLETHPEKHYKNHYAFMRNWLSRAKEKSKPVQAEILVGVAPEPSQRRFCASCGRTGSWHSNESKHGRTPDHEFSEQVAV